MESYVKRILELNRLCDIITPVGEHVNIFTPTSWLEGCRVQVPQGKFLGQRISRGFVWAHLPLSGKLQGVSGLNEPGLKVQGMICSLKPLGNIGFHKNLNYSEDFLGYTSTVRFSGPFRKSKRDPNFHPCFKFSGLLSL